MRALDQYALVHLFQERHDLERDTELSQLGISAKPPTSESVVYKIARREAVPEDLYLSNAPLERRTTAGLAWASRRDVLVGHGLYDACVLGSGDRAILCAALGEFDCGARAVLMNHKQIAHYTLWALPYYRAVRGRVGYLPGRLLSPVAWRVERDRQYEVRHRGLEQFGFDPFTDISLANNGAGAGIPRTRRSCIHS